MDNLRGKTLTGLFWNLLEQVGNQVVAFIPTVFLARLLAPEQFGSIAMLSLFIAIANTFLDSGFSVALIQKKDATYVDECSMFYFNLFIGGVLTLALFLAAPLIAAFYKQPILVGLTRALSFGILIRALDLIQTTRLTRSLDFKTQFKATILGTAVSGAIGVAAAFLGLGVWSLVIQRLANDVISTACLWIINDWRPALVFSLGSLKRLFGFGSRMLSASLINTLIDNLYQAFIGKVFSAAALGFYSRAFSLRAIAIETTSNTVGRVLFPSLASIQDDPGRLKRAYRASILLTTLIQFPLTVGLIVAAKPLVILLFSAKWERAAGYFQLMCIGGFLFPLQVINLDILKVKGRADLFLRLDIIKRVLIVANIVVSYRWGISGILTGQIFIALIAYVLNSYYSDRLIGYPVRSQLLDVLPAASFSLVMGAGAYLAGLLLRGSSAGLLLAVQAGVGAVLYGGLLKLTKAEALRDFVALARRLPAIGGGGFGRDGVLPKDP